MRNFADKPRTLEESLNLIVDNAESRTVVRGAYSRGDKMCSIGCLFTSAQLQWIKKNKANQYRIAALCEKIGAGNFKAMTGMTVKQAQSIQKMNDTSVLGGMKVLNNARVILARRSGNFDGTVFMLS